MRLSRAAARRLGLTAALAPFYYVVVGAVATLLGPKGYSSTAQTMSELAEPGAPRPHFISAAFMGYATLVQGLGPLLHREAGGGWRGRTLWGLVGVYGLGGFLAGVFREGSEEEVLPGVDEDAVHGVAGRCSFAAILTLSVLTPLFFRKKPGWAGWRRFSYAMFAATSAFAFPFQADAWKGKRGLLQRGFFATTMAWVLATALKLRSSS